MSRRQARECFDDFMQNIPSRFDELDRAVSGERSSEPEGDWLTAHVLQCAAAGLTRSLEVRVQVVE